MNEYSLGEMKFGCGSNYQSTLGNEFITTAVWRY